VSDEGSAYDVGRRAIMAVMDERSRKNAESSLGKLILAELGLTDWAAVQNRAATTPDEIFPGMFPVIAAAADHGDTVARDILRRAAKDLASLAREVAERLDLRAKAFLLIKVGGMFDRSSFFDAQLESELKQCVPNAQPGKLRISPAEAAALAANY
jgi:N-acetylglucosamine kinase-like BadF-type ATPase